MFAFGLFVLGVGCVLVAQSALLVHETKSVSALVENTPVYYEEYDKDSDQVMKKYDASVSFKTEAGEPVRTSVRQEFSDVHKMGQTIEIRYYPGNPQSARIANDISNTLWMSLVFLFPIGAGLSFFGWKMLRFSRLFRRGPPQPKRSKGDVQSVPQDEA